MTAARVLGLGVLRVKIRVIFAAIYRAFFTEL
jgi:hypothetical protein